MKCPHCESTSYRKNGHRNGRQNYLCKNCGKQFLELVSTDSLENDLIANNNGHNQAFMGESEELSLENDLPKAQVTEKISDLLNFQSIEKLLENILLSNCLESEAFSQLINKIQEKLEPNNKTETGISILLLDVENIKLDIKVEAFLASICQYPLQVKIGFANWKNPHIGKQDIELYDRGYQLVHVPGGKDGADAKMIAIGACISRYYPRAKEILVCSGDGILNHLCNELQNQGLTVYWVRRQAQTLHVENRNTRQFTFYSVPLATEIPSLEGVVNQIEDLIKSEQESINSRLSNLIAVANLFQERCYLDSHNQQPQVDENNHLTEIPKVESVNTVDVSNSANITAIFSEAKQINSKADLEKLLVEIIDQMQAKSPETKLSVSKLGTELQKISGQSPNSIVKKFKLGASFLKFLQSSPKFQLNVTGKEFEVVIANGQ